MKTTFVIDGDKEFLSFADRHLKLFGYQVQTFSDDASLLDSIKSNPFLIIIGDGFSSAASSAIDLIRQIKKTKSNSSIVHVAHTTKDVNAIESVRAGAYEFIEKDSAAFVRLRTTLELLEKKKSSNILTRLKKVFVD